MARTRPGADRITKQQLQALARHAEIGLSHHLGHCLQCKRAQADVRKRCAYWWGLARLAHQARRKLQQYAQPEAANMDPLPGME